MTRPVSLNRRVRQAFAAFRGEARTAPPRIRYFVGRRNVIFGWTRDPDPDGMFVTFEYHPRGPLVEGAPVRWRVAREVRAKTRSAAIARAQRWYDRARGDDAE